MAVLLLVALVTGVASPEQAIGTPTLGVGTGAQYLPVVSFDGTRFLLAWHDHRNGPGGEAFAVRFDTMGAPLDPTPLRLTAQNQDSDTWGALFDGTNHVVSFVASGRVAVSRVSPQGVVLDPAGIVVATDAASFPAIAFDGTNYLVVWTDGRAYPYDVWGARVSKAGLVLDPGGFPIANGTGFETNPSVAFDGTAFVVVWQEGTTVLAGARVTSGGDVQARTQLAVAASLKDPHVAAHPGGVPLTVYLEGPPGDLRVKGVGVASASAPFALMAESADDEHAPQVMWDGAQYVAVWSDDRSGLLQPYGTRISAALGVLDVGGKRLATTTGHVWTPFLAAGGGGYLLGFIDDRSAVQALYVSRLDAALNPVVPAGRPVLNVADGQDLPALAVTASGKALIAFQAHHHTFPTAELVTLAVPLTTTPMGDGTKKQRTPSIAAAGEVVLEVWDEDGDLYGRRFRADGTALDASAIELCADPGSEQRDPVVAFDGTDFVMAWRDGRMGNSGYALWARRVPVAGTVAPGCGFLVSDQTGDNQPPKIAAGAGTAVVVWWKDPGGVSAVRIQGSARLDATPIALDTGAGRTPAIVRGATDFFVVWSDGRRSFSDLFGARLTSAGARPDGQGVALILAPSSQDNPSVAFDGTRCLVAWDDDRRGKPDVYGTYVTASLEVSDPYGFAIAASAEEDNAPSVAALGPGRFAVAYARFDLTLGSRRLGVRTMTELAQGVAGCTQDAECVTGFCGGGVCCATACGGACQTCATGTCALQAMGASCRAAVSACDAPELCDGAAATCPADLTVPDGLACPNGVCRAGTCQTENAPHFTHPPSVALTCGEAWRYSRSGRAEVTGAGPFTFSARTSDGAALPDGFTLDAMTGEMAWTPKTAQVGTVTVELKVTNADGFDTELVVFDVECDARKFQAGCGAAGPAPFLAAGLLWLLLSGARRAPARAPARSRGSSSSRSRRR